MKTWKNLFPLMRCPRCRTWLHLRGRSQYRLTIASRKEVAEVRGDDSLPSQESTLSHARTREEEAWERLKAVAKENLGWEEKPDADT